MISLELLPRPIYKGVVIPGGDATESHERDPSSTLLLHLRLAGVSWATALLAQAAAH